MPPAQFRCQLNSQRKSRHHTGPGRTLVYIQRTSSARAVPPPTQRLPIQGPYSDLLIRCEGRLLQGLIILPLPASPSESDLFTKYVWIYKFDQ